MIGILAGMGPKSTGPFVDTVVAECQTIYGAKHDMDFPHMMIYSCPTPFYMDRPIDHEAMKKAIIEGAQKLESTGAGFIAMSCNTAHLYFEELQQSLSIPILNIVDETLKAIPETAKRVALLETEATVQAGIYQDGIAKRNIEYIHYEQWQESINQIITYIKSGEVEEARELWSALVLQLKDEVDTAIIACTDLNVVASEDFVDSAQCLAKAVVRMYLSNTKRSS
ncbi:MULTISPECIES: aspartate/glutamate racemase family protein [Bacillus]|uniref:Aspartate racemase family protein n=2 Tax=Bacillus anthracis TaxID=1392 RepID=A0AAC8SFX0_BACAN|nr:MULTISPECIES: amino acid racemase [Bacillus]EJT20401.1 aspartate racemase [Bacillus anthracis str. UR-1]EXJ18407.1 amino acid racemase [Bacillus anthracis str. 95014]AAP28685.1 aspartate racemase family protein [Bacillus anthracis str. Ames]AAT34131.1 aspartate racemase family protein [Bacillus anthracis str. 'Ames Ancestor']AAT56944.1 aspartate racemase family protein [Bacillus anthracis str. Sterne]